MPGSRANSLTARSKAAEGSSIVQKYGIFVPMMNGPYLVLAVLAGYFALLVVVAEWATRQSAADNTQFFTAGRQSPWWLVSFGMIGASLSGVTFVSVPGWVATSQFSYFQMVLGYVAGYAVVAFVLLPLYYRTATTTIYGYLDQRFGISAYRTGAWIFIVSRWVGSSLRLFLVATILHDLVAKPFGLPFGVTVLGVLGLIWLYTHRGGIRAVVVTDTLQTAAMLAVLIWAIVVIMGELGVEQPWTWLWEQPESQWFFPEASDGRNFWKQFLGGMFITITMTGLDQDMMQKNLTCRTLRDAQLNMMVFSGILVMVNLLFLALGVVLYRYASSVGIETTGDGLFAAVAMSPGMPQALAVLFVLGLVAAAYSSADSALTALTTSFSVDILGVERMDSVRAERLRRRVHIGMTVAVGLLMIGVKPFADQSIITTIFTAAGYTYGPLLGLFALGQLTSVKPSARWIPWAALASPLLTYAANWAAPKFLGYTFGFELILLNGLIMALLLAIGSKKSH